MSLNGEISTYKQFNNLPLIRYNKGTTTVRGRKLNELVSKAK